MNFLCFVKRAPRRGVLRLAMLGALVPASLGIVGCGGGSTARPVLPANYRAAANLVYSSVSNGSNAYTARVESLDTTDGNFVAVFTKRPNNGTQNLEFGAVNRIAGVATQRRFEVALESPSGAPFQVGQSIALALGSRNTVLIRQNNPNGDRIWISDGGTAIVTATGANSIALQLNNARFVPSPAFLGTGTFLLNGALSASGLRVVAG